MNDTNTLRVAIVGSGPTGFFAADALLNAGVPIAVDMFDRLPTPFGLVRGGVAPDHPKIKMVTKAFEKLAGDARFSFHGNVELGRHVSVAEMRRFFDAILLATGAETDRRMEIPGEELTGSHAATELVGWYNGHPDYADRRFDLGATTAVVVGQGNVAMDVARILGKTAAELAATDIAAHALAGMRENRIADIHVVGRRGPVQAKFTSPELRELGELATADAIVHAEDLALSPADEGELSSADGGVPTKNLELLRELAARPSKKTRRVHLRFYLSPVRIEGQNGRVRAIVFEKTRLEGDAGAQCAVGTGELVELPCGLVFRSVGYMGKPIPGVPFTPKSGTIPHRNGRVLEGAAPVPGLYAAGWIKRGPSGVIGTNKPCAVESVERILEDATALTRAPERSSAALVEQLRGRGVHVVDWRQWQKIDATEVERGKGVGKPREKIAVWDELLRAVR